MELGFDTIGNATVIVYDRGPLLVTDPWFEGSAYFGSWTLSHQIPAEQLDAICSARFCWISHGHPDHLSMASLRQLSGSTILLPDHVGGRIEEAVRADGLSVRVLPDRQWLALSDRVRVCSIADYNQDGVLLIDVGGRLVIDVNDATDRGWRRFVGSTAARYDVSFLLQLGGYGDADMINLFEEDGERLLPWSAERREPPGAVLEYRARQLGARYVVPFSSMHRYQRRDSLWANEHTAGLDDYARGFTGTSSELLPAFVRYDCRSDQLEEIGPAERRVEPVGPAEVGDDWDEGLDADDLAMLDHYLRSVEHLSGHFAFIGFDVGGVEHRITFDDRRRRQRLPALTFHAPRRSLMTAVEHEIFDDLLIGNFVRTTVHGTRDRRPLYPHFTPYVCKYADNGRARTRDELRDYFGEYRRRAPLDYFRHRIERGAVAKVRDLVPDGSAVHRGLRRAYQRIIS